MCLLDGSSETGRSILGGHGGVYYMCVSSIDTRALNGARKAGPETTRAVGRGRLASEEA